jgi:CHAD domain-containing protein
MAKQRIHWSDGTPAAANARAQLPALVTRYFRAGRALVEKEPSPEELHALRLKTKRLRYTLELFRPCYGPGLDTRLSAFRKIQSLLGDIADCAAARRLIEKMTAGTHLPSRGVERFLAARSARLVTEFCKKWREEFDAPGAEDWWLRYLGQRARRGSVVRSTLRRTR